MKRLSTRTVWIVVCEDLHGAAGPLPTEELARDTAGKLSADGGCTYRPVRLFLLDREPRGRARSGAVGAAGTSVRATRAGAEADQKKESRR